MARPATHSSGPAIEVKLRLHPEFVAILDSFVKPDRSRSATVEHLLWRADEGRRLQQEKAQLARQAKPPLTHGGWTPNIERPLEDR